MTSSHNKIKYLLLITWLSFCVYSLISFYNNDHHEAEALLFGVMSLLTYPICYLVFLFSWLLDTLNIAIPDNNLTIFISWVIFVLLGYYQWFILIPKIFRWIRRRW
jgi:ABC-type multidrug transport system permease subunit